MQEAVVATRVVQERPAARGQQRLQVARDEPAGRCALVLVRGGLPPWRLQDDQRVRPVQDDPRHARKAAAWRQSGHSHCGSIERPAHMRQGCPHRNCHAVRALPREVHRPHGASCVPRELRRFRARPVCPLQSLHQRSAHRCEEPRRLHCHACKGPGNVLETKGLKVLHLRDDLARHVMEEVGIVCAQRRKSPGQAGQLMRAEAPQVHEGPPRNHVQQNWVVHASGGKRPSNVGQVLGVELCDPPQRLVRDSPEDGGRRHACRSKRPHEVHQRLR
mmetsp:Transcript_81203/g.253376  ORF Transcript_81203/g.253376 Transcript_81203/m.253376 type:complete len:275 (-) Transcript_81203:280-1104(-)